MFSGIVHGMCRVQSVSTTSSRLTVELGEFALDLRIGQSVAINGVCLTAVAVDGSIVSFDLVDETLRTTNLGELSADDLVNVERSLRLGDEIGGHLLSGHISGTSQVKELIISEDQHRLVVLIPETWTRYLCAKGFIALNGVSLTLATYSRETGLGSVCLIPETLRRTNLRFAQVGTLLNLEIDPQTLAIVSTVDKFLAISGALESEKVPEVNS